MKHSGQSRGGKARAAKMTPERRKEIAKKAAAARWGDFTKDVTQRVVETPAYKSLRDDLKKYIVSPPKEPVQTKLGLPLMLRDQIALSVLQGLYSNLDVAQKFAGAFYASASLPEAFSRIAYEQADETIRLRSL